MAIVLKNEDKEHLIHSIQRFFNEQMDDDIGQLRAGLVLDFCLNEIGPSIYNQAVADVQSHMQDRVAELDISCHEDEFSYWKNKKR